VDLDKVNEVRRRSAAPRQRVGWVGFCYPALVPLPTLRSPAARRPRPAPPPCPAARRRRAGRPAGAPEGVRRGRAQAYLSLSRARGAEDSIALLDNVASEGSKPSWASSGGAHAEDEDEFGHLARPDRRPAPSPCVFLAPFSGCAMGECLRESCCGSSQGAPPAGLGSAHGGACRRQETRSMGCCRFCLVRMCAEASGLSALKVIPERHGASERLPVRWPSPSSKRLIFAPA
jgi:hypothetical protein